MARFTIEDDTAPATAGFTIEDAPPTPKPTRAQLARAHAAAAAALATASLARGRAHVCAHT